MKTGGFADPSALLGAALYAVIITSFAWFVGPMLRVDEKKVGE
jgi:hypothetical protein